MILRLKRIATRCLESSSGFAAVLTTAEDLELMARDGEAMSLGKGFLQIRCHAFFESNRSTALGTDQVVVSSRRGEEVRRPVFCAGRREEDPGTQKQMKCAKDRCTTDRRMVLVHTSEDLLSRLVSRGTGQGLHHSNAWSGDSVA